VLDSDRSKSVSRDELFMFVYKVWRNQIEDLDSKVHYLDEDNETEAERITELLKERKSIVAAIKRNFPREVRDMLQGMSTRIQGPFTTLFQVDRPTSPTTGLASSQRPSDKSLDYAHGPAEAGQLFSRPTSPKRQGAGAAGEILRFTISVKSKNSPTRGGVAPVRPPTVVLNKELASSHVSDLLAQTGL
jgi:hypothetical protein